MNEEQRKIQDNQQSVIPRRYKRNNNKRTYHKIMNIIGSILIGVLSLIILLILVFTVKGIRSDGPPNIFGYQIFVVRSNSMSPTFETGSLTIVKKMDPALIKVDDIITYQRNGESISATHRVVGIVNEESLQFVTRGDANNTDDPLPVEADAVIGKVTFAIPYVGYVLGFAKTKQGIAVMLVIPGILIMMSQIKQLIMYGKEKKQVTQKTDTV